MSVEVYRTLTTLCALLVSLPIGTNLGLLHVFIALLSGQLLASRGALIPALAGLGLAPAAVRRAWTAFAEGRWAINALLTTWDGLLQAQGRWQPRQHGGYRALVVDTVGFFRPRLKGCRTKHYDSRAGKALPAVELAVVAAVGAVGDQRLAVPRAILRRTETDRDPGVWQRRALRTAVGLAEADDVLVVDAGFGVADLQAARAERFAVRVAKNFTARRATPPAYRGRGRRPTRGLVVRPLARTRKGKRLAATPPDRVERWTEHGRRLRADWWDDVVLPDARAAAPTFRVVAIHDPAFAEPLLLATTLAASAAVLRALYLERWSVEQLPLAAKQLIGAERQWVWAAEARYRLPELAVLAGHLLTYLAASQPAVPTGYWDRAPRRTAGRLRRALNGADFFNDFVLPSRLREKRSATGQLPTGNAARLRHFEAQHAPG